MKNKIIKTKTQEMHQNQMNHSKPLFEFCVTKTNSVDNVIRVFNSISLKKRDAFVEESLLISYVSIHDFM